MSNSPGNNPNAPQLPNWQYFVEKAGLAGNFIGAIFYGIAIILFFQCMGALLNPINRTMGGIKWGLVAHTAAMFSVLTVNAAISLDFCPVTYVDNREFPGNDEVPFPGPYGYQWLINSKAIGFAPSVMFCLNTCLADGFLLYRCYVIYCKSYWAMILPCLMYLASLALSIVTIYYQTSKTDSDVWNSIVIELEVPYYLISLSLNVLLVLMIAIRLVRHSRNIRSALGSTTDGGLYNTVVTMLVESCVLYAVASLLFIGPLSASSDVQDIFVPIFVNIQVIAPFLILLRVANRTALTSDTVASGNIGSIHFRSRGKSTSGNGTFLDENPVSLMETDGEIHGKPGAGAENMIEQAPS